MAEERVNAWETLLRRALEILDCGIGPAASWSLGGGTVLMLRHRHRLSRDIDIFVPDPQLLGYLSPRLNAAAEALTASYVEQANFLKLYFAEGEIDFVVSRYLTAQPVARESVLGREMLVETSAEIIAKKVWHRAAEFTARDLLDLAMIAEREPQALLSVKDVLASRRSVLLKRLRSREAALREDFAALHLLEFRLGFDDCVQAVRDALEYRSSPRAEQRRAEYRVQIGV